MNSNNDKKREEMELIPCPKCNGKDSITAWQGRMIACSTCHGMNSIFVVKKKVELESIYIEDFNINCL